ncbi:phosphotransferase family protein [Halalkalibacillus halophilus]|uniref:phosphotransferase family protein n=1 Tax=Halalkalibacillus halophilus TaxID=392827 RepID=UPI0003FC8643|nr:phosphotransferase family protein [Halalkalibacillus halophilus]
MSIENYVDEEYIDWTLVRTFIRTNLSNIPDEEIYVKKFSEGYSNMTYQLAIGNWEGVLRRPPFGEIPPKAHDMEREHHLLEKVNRAFPLAPKPYLFSEGGEMMDKHFYIMEKKPGIVLDQSIPAFYGTSEKVGPVVSDQVIQTLVDMQSVNGKQPDLQGIGKPEGYLERQVNGWIKRLNRSKTEDINEVKELEKWLVDHMPVSQNPTIVHNDFKLNNILFDEHEVGKVNGVIDWELSTIGDPMTDVGASVCYWGGKDDPDLGINIITDQPGFYSRREFIESYANKSGRDLSQVDYYVAFGFYKLAGILQQIYYRYSIGELPDERFKNMNKSVNNLLEMAELAKQKRLL